MAIDQEIIESFLVETKGLITELSVIVEKIEDSDGSDAPELLSEFAQKIDRIMGAAKTIATLDPEHEGLSRIGKIAEICKHMGYRAAETKKWALLPFFAGFWADVLNTVQELVDCLDDKTRTAEAVAESHVLQDRLKVLAKNVDPSLAALA